MLHSFGFAKSKQILELDERNVLAELLPNRIEISLTGVAEVKRSLEQPIGSPRLHDLVKPGEKVVIITSDITRPMPGKTVLPLVLDELYRAGIPDGDITVVFALGIHRHHTEEEQKHLVGEQIYTKIRCLDSDPQDCVHLGVTKNGTPVDIFRWVAEADRRICLGNIEYHYFALEMRYFCDRMRTLKDYT